MKWLLQGQGQDRGSAAGAERRPPSSERGTQHHTQHSGIAPSSLLSHASCSRLKWRSCSRAAGAVQLSGGGWSRVFPFWLCILLCKASKGFLLKLPLPVSSKQRKPQAHYMWTRCTSCVDGQGECDGSKPGVSPSPTSNQPSATLGPRDQQHSGALSRVPG